MIITEPLKVHGQKRKKKIKISCENEKLSCAHTIDSCAHRKLLTLFRTPAIVEATGEQCTTVTELPVDQSQSEAQSLMARCQGLCSINVSPNLAMGKIFFSLC